MIPNLGAIGTAAFFVVSVVLAVSAILALFYAAVWFCDTISEAARFRREAQARRAALCTCGHLRMHHHDLVGWCWGKVEVKDPCSCMVFKEALTVIGDPKKGPVLFSRHARTCATLSKPFVENWPCDCGAEKTGRP